MDVCQPQLPVCSLYTGREFCWCACVVVEGGVGSLCSVLDLELP